MCIILTEKVNAVGRLLVVVMEAENLADKVESGKNFMKVAQFYDFLQCMASFLQTYN